MLEHGQGVQTEVVWCDEGGESISIGKSMTFQFHISPYVCVACVCVMCVVCVYIRLQV